MPFNRSCKRAEEVNWYIHHSFLEKNNEDKPNVMKKFILNNLRKKYNIPNNNEFFSEVKGSGAPVVSANMYISKNSKNKINTYESKPIIFSSDENINDKKSKPNLPAIDHEWSTF